MTILRRVLPIHGDEDLHRLYARLCTPRGPVTIGFANQHAVNLCWESEPVARAFARLDILLRDGIGARLAMGLAAGRNLNGSDFIPELLCLLQAKRIVLFGTKRPWLEAAAGAIERRWARHRVVATVDGWQAHATYAAHALRHRPDVILLGMGMPRQEELAETLRGIIDWPCLIICGGAILDLLGGRFRRAPAVFRAARLEWAWRLAVEPRRLWRRYAVGIPKFAWRVAASRMGATRMLAAQQRSSV